MTATLLTSILKKLFLYIYIAARRFTIVVIEAILDTDPI